MVQPDPDQFGTSTLDELHGANSTQEEDGGHLTIQSVQAVLYDINDEWKNYIDFTDGSCYNETSSLKVALGMREMVLVRPYYLCSLEGRQ